MSRNLALSIGICLLAVFATLVIVAMLSPTCEGTWANHVVISEWSTRGPGGSTDEFVELYNPTDSDVDISGWGIWTYNASYLFCPEWGERVLLPGAPGSGTTIIPAKHYFLIADGCGSWTGPVPDAWFECTFGFKDDNGTIRLINDPPGCNITVDTVAYTLGIPDPMGADLWAEGGPGHCAPNRGYDDDDKSVARKASATSTDATMVEGGAEYYNGSGWDSNYNDADFFVKTHREPQGLVYREPPVVNVDTGQNYVNLQTAISSAASGDTLQITSRWRQLWKLIGPYIPVDEDYTYNGNLLIDAKEINIVDSYFCVMGDVIIKNGGSLNIDPSWWNVTGNVYVGEGSSLTLDATVLQLNCSSNGQYGIQVNDTATMIVQNGSVIRSRTGPRYWFDVGWETVFRVVDSQIEDCGWDVDNPGLTIEGEGAYFENSALTSNYAAVVFDHPSILGPVSHWRFDEEQWTGAPGEVADSTLNLNNGTAMNGLTTAPGKVGNAADFDATDDYIAVPDSDSLDLLCGITFEAWVYWEGSGSDLHFITSKGIDNLEIHTGGVGNNLIRWVPTGDSSAIVTPEDSFLPDRWNHLVCTYTCFVGGEIYVNGELAVNASRVEALSTNAIDLYIGSRNDQSYPFDGLIDELKIYNRVFSADEARAHYLGMKELMLDCTLSSSTYGVMAFNGSALLAENCSIGGVTFDDLVINNSQVTTADTSFNKSAVQIVGEGSLLTVQWYLDVYVNGTDGNATQFANVTVVDNDNGTFWAQGITDLNGYYNWTLVTEYKENSTTRVYHTPHQVAAWNATHFAFDRPTIGSSLLHNLIMYEKCVHNLDKGLWYETLQGAIDDADPGERLAIADKAFQENITLSKDIQILDSHFTLEGSVNITSSGALHMGNVSVTFGGVSIAEGGLLSIDDSPNTIITDTVWVDGTMYVNSSTWKIDSAFDGEHGIQVNATGSLTVQDNGTGPSTVMANTTFRYWFVAKVDSNLTVQDSVIRDCGYGDAERGLRLETDNATIRDVAFGYCHYAIGLNGSAVTVENCTVNATNTNAFHLNNSAQGTLLNTTFDKVLVGFGDGLSNLTVKWYLDVYVNDSLGNPVSGASVTVQDNANGTFEDARQTDASGHARWFLCTEYFQDQGSTTYYTPHRVLAWLDGNGSISSAKVEGYMVHNTTIGYGVVVNIDKVTLHETIQGAIDNASAGDRLMVNRGTYLERVLVDKSLTIEGNDLANCTVDCQGLGDVLTISADWVNVSGLVLINATSNGISLEGAISNITLNDLVINGTGGHGIYLANGTKANLTISGVEMNDIALDGVSKSQNSTLASLALKDVAIYNPGDRGVSLSDSTSFPARYMRDIVLDNVTVDNATGWYGVYVHMGNGQSQNLTVRNSTLTLNQKGACRVQVAGTVVLEGNTFEGSGRMDDREGWWYGLEVLGKGSPVVSMGNNTIYNNTNGLKLENVSNVQLPGDNDIRENGGYFYFLYNTSSITIQDTTITRSPAYNMTRGISIDGDDVTVSNVTITDSSDGIVLHGWTSSNVTLDGLDMGNIEWRGVLVYTASIVDGMVLSNYTITGSGQVLGMLPSTGVDGLRVESVHATTMDNGITLLDDAGVPGRILRNVSIVDYYVNFTTTTGTAYGVYATMANPGSGNITIRNATVVGIDTTICYGIVLNDPMGVVGVEGCSISNCTSYGLAMDGSGASSLTFDDNTLYDNENGARVEDVDLTLSNSTFLDNVNDIVIINCTVAALNSSLNSSSAVFGDASALLKVQWYAHVRVNDTAWAAVPGASVNFTGLDGAYSEVRTTSLDGWVRWWPVTERFVNQSGDTSYLPYIVHVEGGARQGYAYPDMNASQQVNVTIDASLAFNLRSRHFYPLAQWAIDEAEAGDTILLNNGTFFENIVIDKALNVTGWSRDSVTLDGGGSGDVVTIAADWVNITGVTITGSGTGGTSSGVVIDHQSNCSITDCNITLNWWGIHLYNYTNYTTISLSNIIDHTEYGLYVQDGFHNTLADLSSNKNWIGLALSGSGQNLVDNCTAYQNTYGVQIAGSDGNLVNGTKCIGNDVGFRIYSGSWSNVLANCTIDSSLLSDINLATNSRVTCVNSSFDATKVLYSDTLSELTVQWYLSVHVNDMLGNNITGAYVNVRDNENGTMDATAATDAEGRVRWWAITEYWENATTTIRYTPHTVYVHNDTHYASPFQAEFDASLDFSVTLVLEKLVHDLGSDIRYPTIQEAIDHSTAGSTILVNNGTFHENIVVDKAVTVIGWDRDAVIVNGSWAGDVINVTADGARVANITVTGAGVGELDAGIKLYYVEWCTVDMNNIVGNGIGLYLYNASNCSVYHNNLMGNAQQFRQSNATNTTWDDGQGRGNHWSDYAGQDLDGDGIGDSALPHLGIDGYPLIMPYREAPYAGFVADPTLGNITVTFGFDATWSFDYQEDIDGLIVRWDLDGNGTWDTDWNVTKLLDHQYGTTGNRTVRLEVRDGQGLSSVTTHQITVVNEPPRASFVILPSTTGNVTQLFTFDADGCTDLEYDLAELRVYWDFGDGTVEEFSYIKWRDHEYQAPGTYTVFMEVIDPENATANTTLQVTVVDEAPRALFSVSPASGNITRVFSMDASASWDLEDPGSSLEVRWDYEDDGTWDTGWTSVKTATHQYAHVGNYTIRMEVRDTAWNVTNATRWAEVLNEAPIADFVVTPTVGNLSVSFEFDANSSSDLEDAPSQLNVSWDWEGDGTWDTAWSTAKVLDHAFPAQGLYNVTLGVRDTHGAISTVVRQVEVYLDSDGDGYVDEEDDLPYDPTEWNDTDGDLVGDNLDPFPHDPTEWKDTDGDGVGDNSDEFPSDPDEWRDTDGDGVGDNADDFPGDPDETTDTDGDGLGDGVDLDDDGDGMPDSWEEEYGLDPKDPSDASLDGDGDGASNLDEYRAGTDPLEPGSAGGGGGTDRTLLISILAIAVVAALVVIIVRRSRMPPGKPVFGEMKAMSPKVEEPEVEAEEEGTVVEEEPAEEGVTIEEEETTECPKCGASISIGQDACLKCGKELNWGKVDCPICGEQISGMDHICPHCASPIDGE